MEKLLEEIIDSNKDLRAGGKLADYIPALTRVDPDKIGISLAYGDGNIYSSGDWDHKFTIQSISKVLSLILAVMDNGKESVFKKVDYQASEEAFNTLFKLDFPQTKKPTNPMINAGAIATTSLIKGGDRRFSRILDFYRQVSGNRSLDYNREIYRSEKESGDKNRAIAYLMKARGFIEGNVEEILDAYFKQCSIEVNTLDLAKIGLFIANREDPSTKDIKRLATAIMANSGMYNFSGEYAVEVGIPSKSGVGGGIMGSLPHKIGIGVYSPLLDENGNSIVGMGIMKEIAKTLDLNIY